LGCTVLTLNCSHEDMLSYMQPVTHL